MKNNARPFYKFWPLWVVLVVICGWPWINDWEWDSAKEEAKTLIAQFETKVDAQAAAQAKAAGATAAAASSADSAANAPANAPASTPAGAPASRAANPAQSVSVEMSKLTCIAANSFYASYWAMNSPYRVKLIQAFVWHGYGIEIPSTQAVKERGCGQTADGKYLFVGT